MTVKALVNNFVSLFKKKNVKTQITQNDVINNHISCINSELFQLKLFIEEEIEKFIMKKVVKHAKENNTLN